MLLLKSNQLVSAIDNFQKELVNLAKEHEFYDQKAIGILKIIDMALTILFAIFVFYIIYGIVHILKNKELNRAQKAIWIIVAVIIPVGAAMYLRSTFSERHGWW